MWSLCRQLALKVYDTISTFFPPFENKMKKFRGVRSREHHRSVAEAKGGLEERVRGAHMVKGLREVAQGGLDRLPLLLGRPASPRGLPDLINHFLSSMRSLRF